MKRALVVAAFLAMACGGSENQPESSAMCGTLCGTNQKTGFLAQDCTCYAGDPTAYRFSYICASGRELPQDCGGLNTCPAAQQFARVRWVCQ